MSDNSRPALPAPPQQDAPALPGKPEITVQQHPEGLLFAEDTFDRNGIQSSGRWVKIDGFSARDLSRWQ